MEHTRPQSGTKARDLMSDSRRTQEVDGRLPTFIIIGAARSGTTTVHYVLAQHPQIYMSPNKETNFFSFYSNRGEVPICTRVEDMAKIESSSIKTIDEYRFQFRGVTSETAIGEASPSYLLAPGVPEAIHSFIPDVKLIAILRQPIDKAYSHFLWRCGAGIYSRDTDFGEALELDEQRIAREGRGTSLLGAARYYQYLKPFYDRFDRNQIKICLFEDMGAHPGEFYKDILEYLGVDSTFQPDLSTKFNQSGSVKKGSLARFLQVSRSKKVAMRRYLPPAMVTRLAQWQHRMKSANIERPEGVPSDVRRELTERYYGDEIRNLERLVGRSFSHWLD